MDLVPDYSGIASYTPYSTLLDTDIFLVKGYTLRDTGSNLLQHKSKSSKKIQKYVDADNAYN